MLDLRQGRRVGQRRRRRARRTPTASTVQGGDPVTYRVDVTNYGDARRAEDAEVWDPLPAGITCADLTGDADGGTCNAADRVEWTGVDVAAGATADADLHA